MMTNKVEARIALCIIRAQKSSDYGKGINRISLSKTASRPSRMGYGFKEADILEAIRLIRRNKTQFNYWVEVAPDQNGVNSILVYFDFKIDGKRFQVSFHNHNCGNELESYVNTGRKTHWRKNNSSYYSCIKLQEYYQIPQAVVESDNFYHHSSGRRNGRRPA
jgi:hypothetical protein